MSGFNGMGQFSFTYVWTQDAANAIPITASRMDTQFNDAAQGFDNCVTRDGQSPATANLPLGGFKLTGLGAPTVAGDALSYGTGTNTSTLLVPTRQVFLSGSAATYTTPAGCRQVRIRMVAGGGGGGTNSNTGNNGSVGGTSSFNSVTAIGGGAGTSVGAGGVGGTGGAGTPTGIVRLPGGSGATGMTVASTIITSNSGGTGAPSLFGGGGGNGAGAANTGGGGQGGNASSIGAGNTGGGGGAGEYVEFLINSPSATYTYTVGAGGAAASGISGGGAGGSGIIIVDEFY